MMTAEVEYLKSQVFCLKKKCQNYEMSCQENDTQHLKKCAFDWDMLSDSEVEQFTGFRCADLETLFHVFEPYLHLLQYEDCVDGMSLRRRTTQKNEFLAVMAICRHALPLSIVSWMLGVSQPTMTRIFEGWMTFGDAVLSSINL